MRSSARSKRWWQLTNNTYGFYRTTEEILGTVGWERRAPDPQYGMDKIVFIATTAGTYEAYAEFDNKEQAMAYVEAIVALGD